MTAAFDEFREERGRCADCKCESDDLTDLGKDHPLCSKCYRLAIRDLELKRTDYEGTQDNSGAWEE